MRSGSSGHGTALVEGCGKRSLSFLENFNYLTRSTKKGYFDWLLKLPSAAHLNWLAFSNLTVSGGPDL